MNTNCTSPRSTLEGLESSSYRQLPLAPVCRADRREVMVATYWVQTEAMMDPATTECVRAKFGSRMPRKAQSAGLSFVGTWCQELGGMWSRMDEIQLPTKVR